MRLGNDTSREILADNFARNRGQNFVQLHSKKWLCHFFDSLRRLLACQEPPFVYADVRFTGRALFENRYLPHLGKRLGKCDMVLKTGEIGEQNTCLLYTSPSPRD